jgi:hypothetical protein
MACISVLVTVFLQLLDSNVKKRKHYPDDLKISIYFDLLAKTDPPILRRGVSKSVSEKYGVPLRVVQTIWKNGQDGGLRQDHWSLCLI